MSTETPSGKQAKGGFKTETLMMVRRSLGMSVETPSGKQAKGGFKTETLMM